MSYSARHPAAFINALSEGPKADVLTNLQQTWDELVDAKALLRQAIKIIAAEREIAFESYRVPGTDEIPNADERAEVRRYDRWLKKAKAAVA